MTIQGITLFVSAISAIAAVAGATIALLVYLKSNRVDPPKLGISINSDGLAYRIEIAAKNWSTQNWAVTDATVLRPPGCKIVSVFDARRPSPSGELMVDVASMDWMQFSSRARMYLKVAPVGAKSSGLIMGQNDSAHETLLLSVPDSVRSKKLSMRLSLVSNDAKERAKTIVIKRTLPDATNTATD